MSKNHFNPRKHKTQPGTHVGTRGQVIRSGYKVCLTLFTLHDGELGYLLDCQKWSEGNSSSQITEPSEEIKVLRKAQEAINSALARAEARVNA